LVALLTLAFDLQVPGDVTRRVVDDLLAEAVEEAVEEHVGDDRESGTEHRDRAALAVAQEIARGDEREDRQRRARRTAHPAPAAGEFLADAADRRYRLQRRCAKRRVQRHRQCDQEHQHRNGQAALATHDRIDDIGQALHRAQPRLEGREVDTRASERRRRAEPDGVAQKQPGRT
jgi:hypothetical protein